MTNLENRNDLLSGSKRIHFIGIGGSGMFPLAQILLAHGHCISGSDNNPGETIDLERELGMKVTIGQKPENLRGAELIVYSAAILPDNPELLAARAGSVPVLERSELFGLVSREYEECIAVCGTHGKTTTTALLTHILLAAGKDPSAVIGGRLPEIGGNGRAGKSDLFVCEACEYVDTFLHLSPSVAVVLNVDADHLEYFGTIENIIHSFHRFACLARNSVIANGDDANTRKAIEDVPVPVITFGYGSGNDYAAANVRRRADGIGYRYDLMHGGVRLTEVKTGIPGEHNVLNSLAAIAAAMQVGVSAEEAAAGVKTFRGAHRRFEVLGTKNGVTIADDYAHHPREIEVTLRAAKELGFKHIWAVHQPFTYSRTAMLLDDFARVLSLADHVVLSEIMGSREYNTYNVYAADLAAKIPGCVWFPAFEEIARYVMEHAEEGDLVVTLGCGDVYKCAYRMLS